jgi:hypothetical protein
MPAANTGGIQWGDVATWVASVGTVLAVVVALIQVARERRARQADEAQDRADRHLAHARLISAWLGPAEAVPAEQRVDYTDTTADWKYNYRTPIYIHNSSAEPIYEVVPGIVFIQGGGGPRTLEDMLSSREQGRRTASELMAQGVDGAESMLSAWQGTPITTVGIVPPGTWRVWIQGKGWTRALSGRGGADVAFVDRAGASWARRAMGQLEELPTRPLEHFGKHGLYGPYEFQMPESTAGISRAEPEESGQAGQRRRKQTPKRMPRPRRPRRMPRSD